MQAGKLTTVALGLCLAMSFSSMGAEMNTNASDALIPAIKEAHVSGEMGNRIDAVVENWLLTVRKANPGIIEMFRLRDRHPDYENPLQWSGEFVGKHLTASVLMLPFVDTPDLREETAELVDALVSTQAEDGYLGPFRKDTRLLGQWDLWGHYHAMYGLYLWYLETGDEDALQTALRAADLVCKTYVEAGKNMNDAGWQEMNLAMIHSLGILYRETGKEVYFDQMKAIIRDWEQPPAGNYYKLALEGLEFYQTPKPRWESLHPMMGLAEMYRITGDDSYKEALLHWWDSIMRTDVHNAGSFSTGEGAIGTPFKPGAIETCCTVAWMAYSVECLRVSGDSQIADALETATWNAVLGFLHPSGRWCTYDSPMAGKRLAATQSIAFQARPGTPELSCCSVNAPRGLAMLSEWAVMSDGNGDPVINYYGPGMFDAVMSDGSEWKFTQETDYPVGGDIRIRVSPGSTEATTVRLRIPAWSKETAVGVGSELYDEVKPGTYLDIERVWEEGDIIDISLDMSTRLMSGGGPLAGKASVFAGPILLTYAQEYNEVDPAEVTAIEPDTLELVDSGSLDMLHEPIVAYRVSMTNGGKLTLADFATAGAHGTFYDSWLPAEGLPPAAFLLGTPEENDVAAPEPFVFTWTKANADALYTLRIGDDEQMENALVVESGISEPSARIDLAQLGPGTYYWDVQATSGGQSSESSNGPRPFVVSEDAPSRYSGTVVKASLAGDPDPEEGVLLTANDLAPASGPGGSNGALRFNGDTSRLVYKAESYPIYTQTFSAWVRPEAHDDSRLHQIFCSWFASRHDPLRVFTYEHKLTARMEHPRGNCSADGPLLPVDKWSHVAVVLREDQTMELWLDGKLQSTTEAFPWTSQSPQQIGVGCNPVWTENETFLGSIADVLFVREALSEEDIVRLATRTQE